VVPGIRSTRLSCSSTDLFESTHFVSVQTESDKQWQRPWRTTRGQRRSKRAQEPCADQRRRAAHCSHNDWYEIMCALHVIYSCRRLMTFAMRGTPLNSQSWWPHLSTR